MNHRRLLVASTIIFSVCMAASAAEENALIEGKEILKPFKEKLQTTLQNGMKKGVIETISACQIEAPKIAASMSSQGIIVGRTSHKLRNPSNTAPAWVAPILAEYLANSQSRQPRNITINNHTRGYVEPIELKPMCVICHGEHLANDLANKIAALYPADQATGFKLGDLRGVFWVEYPAP